MTAVLSDDAMPDRNSGKLSEALQRLSTHPRALSRERRELFNDPRNRLDALLREIHEVVLPRTLVLSDGSQDFAKIEVANRRIRGMSLLTVGKEFMPLEAFEDQAIPSNILTAAQKTTHIKVAPSEARNRTSNSSVNISVSDLRHAFELGHQCCSLTRLSELVEDHCQAKVAWAGDDNEFEFEGDDILYSSLHSFATDLIANLGQADGDLLGSETGPFGFAIPIDKSNALLVAFDGPAGMCCVAPLSESLKAIGDWQTLLV